MFQQLYESAHDLADVQLQLSNYNFLQLDTCSWIARDFHVNYVRFDGFLLNIAYFYLSRSCLLVSLEYANPILE